MKQQQSQRVKRLMISLTYGDFKALQYMRRCACTVYVHCIISRQHSFRKKLPDSFMNDLYRVHKRGTTVENTKPQE